METLIRIGVAGLALAAYCFPAAAQSPGEMARILERLERLERENRELSAQVRALEARMDGTANAPADTATAAAPVAVEQKLAIQERQLEELAQTKVEASQKFPIRITGLALFNAFLNSRQSGGAQYPAVAGPTGASRSGATVRQTVVALEYRGPTTVWGGNVQGSMYMDLFVGNNNPTMRVRTATIELEWKTRSVLVGLEKPIFNPREPASLAQVGISPMTGTGNLWLWLPQARFQQDFRFTRRTGLMAQVGVVQTREAEPFGPAGFNGPLEEARPAWEGRFEVYHRFDDQRRVEFAPGFHVSRTHAGGRSAASSLYSMDWFVNPVRRVELSGAFYSGKNVAMLGNGYQQGVRFSDGVLTPVRSAGGWGQVKVRAASRVDLHFFTGRQDDDDRDLMAGRIGKNSMYGANLFYRLAPNVLAGLEASQLRTMYLGQGLRINNHYDLALAYFF